VSLKEKEMGLNRDLLDNKDTLMRYPILEEFTTDILYQKALVLQRSVATNFFALLWHIVNNHKFLMSLMLPPAVEFMLPSD